MSHSVSAYLLTTERVRSAQSMQMIALRAQACITSRQTQNDKQGATTMSTTVNHQILLTEKPTGKLGPEHFRMVENTNPKPNKKKNQQHKQNKTHKTTNRAWM